MNSLLSFEPNNLQIVYLIAPFMENNQTHCQKILENFSLRYLEGGIESGFVDVSKLEFRKKLYHIKGRRKVRITQTEVSWRSLNEGDVFVLECKDTVWCWVGMECSRLEKIKVHMRLLLL